MKKIFCLLQRENVFTLPPGADTPSYVTISGYHNVIVCHRETERNSYLTIVVIEYTLVTLETHLIDILHQQTGP